MTKPCCFGVFLLSMALPLLAQEAEPSTGTAGQAPSPATPPSVQLIPRSPEARQSASRAARPIILNVVVTDTSGKPVPALEPGVAQASAKERNYFDAIVDLSTGFRVAQMTLDAVSSPELWHFAEIITKSFSTACRQPTRQTPATWLYKFSPTRVAARVMDGKDLAGEIATCIADTDSYYVLSYDFTTPAPTDIEYRALQVMVDKPGLISRTNPAYYARP
jgi:hypothetical protein